MEDFSMTEYTVGSGGDFVTLAAAAKAVKAGDVVHIRAGVYRELLTLDTPRVAWVGEPGAVIDGGWDGKTKTESWANQVTFKAPGVTVRGLTIRNCPGRGVAILADDPTLEKCIVENTYRGAILVGDSTGAPISGVTIRGNVFRRMSLAWDVGDRGKNGRSVNGSFNVQNVRSHNAKGEARPSVIEDNVLHDGNGEAYNIGRGSEDVLVIGNEAYSTSHVGYYTNHAARTIFERNIFYHIPNPKYGGAKGDKYSAAFVIGDEAGIGEKGFPPSHGTVIRGNVVVNAGKFLQVRNNKHNYDTKFLGTVVEDNTFIAGPQTTQGIMIQANVHGRPHKDSVVRNNVIDMTHAANGAVIAAHPQGSGVEFVGNAWSRQPPAALRSPSDVVGTLGIVRPDAPRDKGLDLENYRPLPDSPLVRGDGFVIGALAPKGGTPPEEPEPPEEPPTDPPEEPEPPEEPDISDRVLEELRAVREMVMAALDAGERALGAVDKLIALLESGSDI